MYPGLGETVDGLQAQDVKRQGDTLARILRVTDLACKASEGLFVINFATPLKARSRVGNGTHTSGLSICRRYVRSLHFNCARIILPELAGFQIKVARRRFVLDVFSQLDFRGCYRSSFGFTVCSRSLLPVNLILSGGRPTYMTPF